MHLACFLNKLWGKNVRCWGSDFGVLPIFGFTYFS